MTHMAPRITAVTLGVADLAASCRFYCVGLGWPLTEGSSDQIAFFDMGGLVLALYGRDALAADAHVEPDGTGFAGFTLGHNVRHAEEVDLLLAAVVAAGGRLRKPAEDTFWGGRSGYFEDPDGYLWEIAWNPHWPLDALGRVKLA